jgi:hypothetical protein
VRGVFGLPHPLEMCHPRSSISVESHHASSTVRGMKIKTTAAAIAVGLAAISLPCLSFAETAEDIFRRAQEQFSQEEKNQASWTAGSREAADRTLDNLKATRCSKEDSEDICQIVSLCSRAPQITGEILPDDKELMAAQKALDDAEDDLKKMATTINQMKIASARFERGARAARDKCEAKVRVAYRSISSLVGQPTTSDPDPAVEAHPLDDIYNGPVAVRPMVTAPQLMRRVSPTATNASQTPSARP